VTERWQRLTTPLRRLAVAGEALAALAAQATADLARIADAAERQAAASEEALALVKAADQ